MDLFSTLPYLLSLLQYGLQRILGDERSLLLLARAIDPKQTNMMTEIVKILSAICIIGEENMWVEWIISELFSQPPNTSASFLLRVMSDNEIVTV